MIDVPDADVVVDGLALAEADAAAVASSRCPGVAAVVPPADVIMPDAVASADHLLRKLPVESKNANVV